MIPPSPGQCIVCGQESTLRCGDCAKHGTDWLYFCGTEHQRLVWSMHKRVCGERSNPFIWPGFTDRERKEMPENCTTPMWAIGPGFMSGIEILMESMNKDPKDEPYELSTDKQDLFETRDPGGAFRSRQSEVLCIRRFAHRIRRYMLPWLPTHTDNSEATSRVAQHPFDYLAQVIKGIVDEELEAEPGSITWLSTFLHLFAIVAAVVCKNARTSLIGEHFQQNLTYPMHRLERFVEENEVRPEIRRKVRDYYVSLTKRNLKL